MEGMGVNITIMSYRGIMYWGIISCPETMPKVWGLAAGIPVALDELLGRRSWTPATYRNKDAAIAVKVSGAEITDPDPGTEPA